MNWRGFPVKYSCRLSVGLGYGIDWLAVNPFGALGHCRYLIPGVALQTVIDWEGGAHAFQTLIER